MTTLTKQKFLSVGKPDISEAEITGVSEVLRSGWLGTGNITKQFEEEFARFMGVKEAVAMSSCTMGLILALKASGVKEGDEVITTPLTFAATVNAIIVVGAKPVFAEVDSNGLIKHVNIHSQINSKTRAILPVHYLGAACQMEPIMKIAKEYKLKVIEDAAQAFGGTYETMEGGVRMSRKLGVIGHYGVFSFYANKNITCGEGGMLLSSEGNMEFIRVFSQQGLSAGAWNRYSSEKITSYEVSFPGIKGNLPDVLSAIGFCQLRRWNELKRKRKKIWDIYEKNFGLKPVGHSMHLYAIQFENRDELRNKLLEEGIGTGIHYKPLHLEPGYKYLGYREGDFPMAEKIGKETLSLPLSSTMTEEDAWRVVEAVHANT